MHKLVAHSKELAGTRLHVLTWLTVAAVADWLIGRTLTRAVVFMPKVPAVSTAFDWLGAVGQLSHTISALLATAVVAWITWREINRGRRLLPASFIGLLVLSLLALFVAPSGWLPVAYHVFAVTAILSIALEAWKIDSNWRRRIGWGIPAAAMLAGEFYIMASALNLSLGGPSVEIQGRLFFNLGELLYVASGFALWGYYGRKRLAAGARILAMLAALAFSIVYLAQPAMAGIISIWSLGLTLYLPWPLYTLSLFAALIAVMVQLRVSRPVGLGILLFMAAGFAPQLSHQFMMGLVGLLLISWPQASAEGLPSPPERLHSEGLPLEA